jgi:hypothetical protein
VTDASGIATAQFIPGSLTTAGNGVVIQATVPGTGVVGTANLTVSTQALFISIAEGNTITNLDENTYEKPFSVYVTDVNGAPAVNRVVTLSVWADEYGKGTLVFNEKWGYAGTPTWCLNEDINRNGILDAGEDTTPTNPQGNNNGKLDPGLPVVISPASVTTDNTGFAQFKLQYGENFALWADTTITARAVVGGTESVSTRKYFLLMSAPDATNEATPANARSPWGIATSCSNPN